MLKRLFNRKKETNVNEQVSELIKAHGFESTIIKNKIIPNFKEKVQIETWIYPQKNGNMFQTRFDIGVKFENGVELYEAFGDIGNDFNECIKKNLENFSNCSLHVFLDAFNDTKEYTDKENWGIGNNIYSVFIGNYAIKSFSEKEIEIPQNLFSTLESIVKDYKLEDDFYFIRFFYGHNQNKTLATEFMINNVNLEKEERKLSELNWMNSNEYYSIRNFIILKRIKK